MFSTSGTLLYANNPNDADSDIGSTDNSSSGTRSPDEDADDMVTRPVENM